MEQSVAVFVRMPPAMAERVRQLAQADARTLAAWVRLAIEEKIRREDGK